MSTISRYSIPLAFALAIGPRQPCCFALAAANLTAAQPTTATALPEEPIVGVGYHPGNFIGPLAFDVIVRPLPHITLDVQAGYSTQGITRSLGIAPQLQWEFWRGLRTPYLGLAFRYEKVWLNGAAATSTGGALLAGWQVRWRSGLGVLFGIGVLYKTATDIRTAAAATTSDGGFFGTYEVGLRYFF